jgi:F0F1-type ATP synthase membrane subunit b/b'
VGRQQAKDPLERAELLLGQLREAIREAGGVLKDMQRARRDMTEFAQATAPALVEDAMKTRVEENLREIREFVNDELALLGRQIPKTAEAITTELMAQAAEELIKSAALESVQQGITPLEALEKRLTGKPVFRVNLPEGRG